MAFKAKQNPVGHRNKCDCQELAGFLPLLEKGTSVRALMSEPRSPKHHHLSAESGTHSLTTSAERCSA